MADRIKESSQPPTILLLGMTGAGKSKFISAAIGEKAVTLNGPVVGHGMASCTTTVQAFEATNPCKAGESVRLIDTPGFDNSDGSRDDTQLKKIVNWLKAEPNTKINGILYLHDIQHWHFIKNLLMQPQDISWPPGASVVTTNWPSPPLPAQFKSSEDNFRKHLAEKFASTASGDADEKLIPRFDYTTESAWKILTAMKISSSKALTASELATKLERFCREFEDKERSRRSEMKSSGSRRLFNGLFARLF